MSQNICSLADIIQLTGAQPIKNGVVIPKNSTKLSQRVSGIAPLDSASASDISFLANPKYQADLAKTQALAVFVSQDVLEQASAIALVVPDPYLAFAQASHLFAYQTPALCASANKMLAKTQTGCAHIADSAQLAEDVQIAPNCFIGEHVRIGAGTVVCAGAVLEDCCCIGESGIIGANAVIHHHCQLGDRVRVHAGAIIGAEGFGFAPAKSTQSESSQTSFYWQRIAQLGRVIIGDDVRIGAGTCIDRGALSDTIIDNGVIIDNLVQIAHNVIIGEHTAIAACTGIAGSTRIGARCVIAGGVGIAGHICITDDVQITGMSMVTGSIRKPGSYSSGTGVMPTQQWRKAAVNFKHLAKRSRKTKQDSSYTKNTNKTTNTELEQLQAQINDLKKALNKVESRLD